MTSSTNVPLHWVASTVGDIFADIGGGTPSTDQESYWNGNIPWITSADIDELGQITPRRSISEKAVESSATNKVPAGSVVVVTRVGLGKVGVAETDLCFSQDCQALVFDQGLIEPKFVAQQMRMATQQFHHVARGTTISGVTKKQLRDTQFVLPPLEEQRRIAQKIDELFSDLDAGISALEKARANLKRYRAAVLKAAVEGKLTEQWRKAHPDVEPASKLLERILAERRRKWEEAQLAKFAAAGKAPPKGWKDNYQEPAKPDAPNLPNLPEGWCLATIDQTSEVQGGIQKQPKRAPKNNAYPYLRVANVYRNRLDLAELEYFELFGEELKRLRLEYGDLLIVEGNGSKTEIGRSAIWREEVENCVHQNHIIRARFLAGIPEYLNAYWNSPTGNGKVMEKAASTSGLYTLSVQKVSELPLPLPPVEEQQRIVEEVESRLSVIAHSELEVAAACARATRLRQAILKRAFEGKLVPQDPSDEPASVLLERIRNARAAESLPRAHKRRKSPA